MSAGDNSRRRREEFIRNSGYECDLVEEHQTFQWQCQICHCILREPHQVSCCGFSFCKVCIQQAQAKKRECPLCNVISLRTFHDKGLQRLLNALRVYCTHKDKGCEWEGELGELGRHLNSTPTPNNRLAGCKFEDIECCFCSQLFQRNCLHSHQSECPMRPFSCMYCCQYDSTYADVTQNHWDVCASYPLHCRNCEQEVQRKYLECHVNRDCPNTSIVCDFHIVGCPAQLARKNMPSHISENISGHMQQLQEHSATQPVQTHVMYVPLLVGSMQKVVKDNVDTQSRLNEAEKSLRESQETISHQKTELENLHKELEQTQQRMEMRDSKFASELTGVFNTITELQKQKSQGSKEESGHKQTALCQLEASISDRQRKQDQRISTHQSKIQQEFEQHQRDTNSAARMMMEQVSRKAHEIGESNTTKLENSMKLWRKTTNKTLAKHDSERKDLIEDSKKIRREIEALHKKLHDVERARNELEAKTTDTFTGKISEVYKSINEDRRKQAEIGNMLEDMQVTTIQFREDLKKRETAMKVQEQKQNEDRRKQADLRKDVEKLEKKQHTTETDILKLTKQGAKQDDVEGALKEVKSSVEKINRLESTLAVQGQTLLRISSSGTLPVTFTISNVKERKGRNEEVESPSFYTHPHGYRLCAHILLNGEGPARELYITVYFYLMQGMFDDDLSWPFQGEIKFELVNQLRDMQHHQCTVNFARCPNRHINDRVRIRVQSRRQGFGLPKFIAHSQLGPDNSYFPLKQYLKDDQLKFRIVEVLNIQPIHVSI